MSGSFMKPDHDWDLLNRKDINLEIIKILEFFINDSPSMRFGQLLCCLDMEHVDFNSESLTIYNTILNSSLYKENKDKVEDYLFNH